MSSKPTFQKAQPRETLSRDMGLLPVTMIGVGAMIGAGIFVLTGIAAGAAGPALMLSFLLNGFVTIFTAMVYAELGSSFHDAGGGYLWVKEGLPQPNGFISGWMSWFAHMVACSLYSLGFGAYFSHILKEVHLNLFGLSSEVLAKILAVIIVFAFSYINLKGASETGSAAVLVAALKIGVLALFITFGLIRIFKNPVSLNHFKDFMPNGWGGVFIAMGLTFIAFEGYEIIAQCSEEVKNPKRNIPRAIFLSLLIVVPIYILIAFVSIGAIEGGGIPTWKYLGIHKETALVEAARYFMPYGALIILVGGLFSTMSALNATIYSSSRVSFAMGRDHNLPDIFGHIHLKKKTPHWSILLSGIFIAVMAVALPIEDVASAADIMFLLLFLLVNFAVINLRRSRPDLDRGYLMPLFPIVPIMGIVTKLFLAIYMFNYSPTAWYVTIGWIVSGLIIFYGYSRHKEKDRISSRIAVAEKTMSLNHYRILVSLGSEEEVQPLLKIASSISKQRKGGILALSVASIPDITLISGGKQVIEKNKQILQRASLLRPKKIPFCTEVRIAHRIDKAIIDATYENNINLVMVGWKGYTLTKHKLLGEILDPVVREIPTDLAVVRFPEDLEMRSPKKILVPLAGGPHALLGLELALDMARHFSSTIEIVKVIPLNSSEVEEKKQLDLIDSTLEGFSLEGIKIHKQVIRDDSVELGLVRASEKSGLLVIGASNIPLWKRLLFGTIPQSVAKNSKIPVIMVKRYEGRIKSWFRKFLSG